MRIRVKRPHTYLGRTLNPGSIASVSVERLGAPVELLVSQGWFEVLPEPRRKAKRKQKGD